MKSYIILFLVAGILCCKSKDGAHEFEVAFVYVGPIGDGGWTYAHNQARLELERMLPFVKTSYVENVTEGAQAKQVIKNLARKGARLIITTSFGFMDATEESAKDFPDVNFLHISGYKSNDKNFANLMGAMESMKYLCGIIAGARAKEDQRMKIGYIAPFPIAEVIRMINAAALGMKKTCPECVMEIRWINSWFDPPREMEAAESLIQAQCDVVITGADTPGPVALAGRYGRWGIGYDSNNACRADPEHCLTTAYWRWAYAYKEIIESIRNGSFKGGNHYFDVDKGIVGLYGFEDGEEVQKGVPSWVVPIVKDMLSEMKKGNFTRFDIFRGPIRDNKGRLVIEDGKTLEQEDLEGLKGIPGRKDCSICMNWLVDGVIGQLP